MIKITVFDLIKSAKIDFTENQSNKKNDILPHCILSHGNSRKFTEIHGNSRKFTEIHGISR